MFRSVCLRFVFICSLCTFHSLNAQNWLTGDGGATNDEALDVANDTSGNYYVTGYFTSSAKFGTTTLVSHGNSDIFIAKYNSEGLVQWAVGAGGNKSDKAYSIKCDKAGNIYVTGLYYGSATFGTTTIVSQSNSQDVFIAKYNKSGILIWVKTVGGDDVETGYGITSDKDGNVIVTGQFKGTAIFGTSTLTSTTNQTTGLPSFDIFTTKFDKNGVFLWVKQGLAKLDDRGLDVTTDNANNIFVTGQFSDTIKFDVVHNNGSVNAGYVMKYDKSGNEQWFVRINSSQTLINSIDVNKNNEVIITGDYQGVLRIFTNPIVTNTSSFQYKIFVAKFGNSGNLIWVDNDGSNSEITSKSIAIDSLGNSYIAGLFKCRFDEYSQQLGAGIFYSSGYRDVFVTKYSASGQRGWFKHFGSNKDDYCSGIAVKIIDKPVIAGSFENRFNVPNNGLFAPAGFKVIDADFLTGNLASKNCNYTNYQHFVSKSTSGQKDIFVTSPIDTVSSQAPFDYFKRKDAGCDLGIVTPCINNCEDTVHSCGPINGGLHANPFELDTTVFGALYDYTWNTGSKLTTSNTISKSGIYWLQSKRSDGCFVDQDSIYVVIHDVPWITDSKSMNINSPPTTKPIRICKGETVTLWGTHSGIRDSVRWKGPLHTTVNDSTIKITEAGTYTFNTYGAINCSNNVELIVDTFAIHGVLDPRIVFKDPVLQATDTVHICAGQWYDVSVIDSAFYAINKDIIPFKTVFWSIDGGGMIMSDSTVTYNQNYFTMNSGGWYTIKATLVNRCGDKATYPIKRSIFVIVNQAPGITLKITGPSNVCPGDTVTLYAKSNVTNFYWTGSKIYKNLHDSIIVIAPMAEQDEYYYINYAFTDSITGCAYSLNSYFRLHTRSYPHVVISPTDGIICPNDSALLTCETGVNYKWVSSTGTQISTNKSIYVDVPGKYFCIQTSVDGCTQSSNIVEAKEYNTPFLEAEPNTVICANGSVTIRAIASNLATIDWQSPLSGNQTTKTITASGTYKCNITQCGILTNASVVITKSTATAVITASDTILCPGDTITLQSNFGMNTYNWLNQNNTNSTIKITQAGTYTLQTTNDDGCIGTSKPITITSRPFVASPSFNNSTICAGDSVTFSTAPNVTLWYDAAIGGNLIYKGTNFISPSIHQPVTFYAQTDDITCKSDTIAIKIDLVPTSMVKSILQKDTVCEGGTVTLWAEINDVNYFWKGPNGFSSTQQGINLTPVGINKQGLYTQQYDVRCPTSVDSVFVTVIPPPNMTVPTIVSACSNEPLHIPLTSDSLSTYIWFAADNVVVTNETNIQQQKTTAVINDTLYNPTTNPETVVYYAIPTSMVGKCDGQIQAINVIVNHSNYPASAISENLSRCYGDSIKLSAAMSNRDYSWKGPNGFKASTQSITINPINEANQGIYTQKYVTECSSIIDSFFVSLNELPVLSMDDVNNICSGTTIDIPLFCEPESSFSWKAKDNANTNGESTSEQTKNVIDDVIDNLSASPQTIVYSITPTSIKDNCVGSTQTINVTINPTTYPISATIEKDTILEGGSTTLHVITDPALKVNWQPSETLNDPHSFNPIATPKTNTTYTVSILDGSGCPITARVSIVVLPLDCALADIFVPNTFTPNNDNTNDVLFVRGYKVSELYFAVYNRWGEMVFETTDIHKGWDGTYKGMDADPVVFDWYLRAKCYNGNKLEKKGNVTLLR